MNSEQNWKDQSLMAGAMLLGAAAGMAVASSLDEKTKKVTVTTLAISGLVALLPQVVSFGVNYLNRPSSQRVQAKKLRRIRGEGAPTSEWNYPEVEDEELYGV